MKLEMEPRIDLGLKLAVDGVKARARYRAGADAVATT